LVDGVSVVSTAGVAAARIGSSPSCGASLSSILSRFLYLVSGPFGVGELRPERIVVLAEPAEAGVLCFEFSTGRYELAPKRTLDIALFLEVLTELARMFERFGEFVALIERHGQYRRLRVTSLTGTIGPYPVRVRAPFARPAALAGNRHAGECNETRRNVHPAGDNL
jgi:hypothetical protein